MRVLRDTWRREARKRPAAARLALIGIGTLALGACLAGAGSPPLAQLIAGLALVPLALAAFLRLLPPPPWSGPEDGGDPGWGDHDRDGPRPSDGPSADIDWERFERQFRAYVAEREAAAARSPRKRDGETNRPSA